MYSRERAMPSAHRGDAVAPEDTELCSRSHEVCHEERLITQFTTQISPRISLIYILITTITYSYILDVTIASPIPPLHSKEAE